MSVPFANTLRSLAAASPRFSLLAWLLAAVLLVGWGAWFLESRVSVLEVSREARLEVEQTAYPINAPAAGKIATSHLVLGQDIRAGQLLVELDASRERLQLNEEEARLRALPPQIEALKQEIASQSAARDADQQAARRGLETAQARQREAAEAAAFGADHSRRLDELRGRGRIPEVDALRSASEAKKLASADQALKAELRRLEADLKTRGLEKAALIEDRKRQAALLAGQLETARASVSRLQQEIEKRHVRAPIAGRLGDAKPLQPGAYVSEGEKLAALVPSGNLRIVASFPPGAVMGRIRPGQSARMRLDGFPWAQYGVINATVKRVATEIRDQRVRVEFTPETAQLASLSLQHGLPGSIEVDIEQVAPAVLLLRAAGQRLAARSATAESVPPADAPRATDPS